MYKILEIKSFSKDFNFFIFEKMCHSKTQNQNKSENKNLFSRNLSFQKSAVMANHNKRNFVKVSNSLLDMRINEKNV